MKRKCHRKAKSHKVQKGRRAGVKRSGTQNSFGYVQEILLLLAAVCAIGSLIVEPPWSGVLMLAVIAFFAMILLNMKFNKRLKRQLRKIKPIPMDSAAEANMLMNGLDHKNHYQGLPEAVRKKSMFGKLEGGR